MKNLKKILAVLLAVTMFFTIGTVAFAEETNEVKVTISSSNVAGLPIPAVFSDDGKVVKNATKITGKLLNESGVDIVCVQEDFQYHSLLAKQMTNYPYQTFTSGGVPVGDGLNVYSKYPIYNIDRVEWKEFHGVLDAANDGLTPKGFLKCTVDVKGVLIDVYDIHIDAGALEDCPAKKAQFIQLCEYMNENSVGRPIAVTGDFNAMMHGDIPAELYPIMIQGAGFNDAWTLFCNDGVYFTGYLSKEQIAFYDEKWGGDYWGRWDSVERLLFRDGDGTKMTVTDHKYVSLNELAGENVTDHNVMVGELTIDTTDYVRPTMALNEPQKMTSAASFGHTIKMYLRCITLLVTDLIAKLSRGELIKK